MTATTKAQAPAASHPLTPNGSRDLVIVEVPLKLGGHVVVGLLLVIWLPL